MKLEITADKVREGAKECPQAEKVLKKMFPEAFEPEIDLTKLTWDGSLEIFSWDRIKATGLNTTPNFFQVRHGGKYHKKAFYLGWDFDWQIVTEGDGSKVLVFTKK